MKVIGIVFVLLFAVLFTSSSYAACTIKENNDIKFTDLDCDGVVDKDIDDTPVDICPVTRNGDCDADPSDCDIDEDGRISELEARAGDQADWNHNGIGDACEDTDGDGVVDYLDNCLTKVNPGQNIDDCDDSDGDRIDDSNDNCPKNYNTRQIDTDVDNVGDVCDTCALDYNPDQKTDLCDSSNGLVGANADIANPGSNTDPSGEGGINYVMYNREMGSGGCSLIASNVSSVPSAVLGAFLLSIIAVFRKKS